MKMAMDDRVSLSLLSSGIHRICGAQPFVIGKSMMLPPLPFLATILIRVRSPEVTAKSRAKKDGGFREGEGWPRGRDRPSTIPSVVRQAVLDGALASAHGSGIPAPSLG